MGQVFLRSCSTGEMCVRGNTHTQMKVEVAAVLHVLQSTIRTKYVCTFCTLSSFMNLRSTPLLDVRK